MLFYKYFLFYSGMNFTQVKLKIFDVLVASNALQKYSTNKILLRTQYHSGNCKLKFDWLDFTNQGHP